ncbi:MAG: nucleotidyltransferase [Bhargavaea sp.]
MKAAGVVVEYNPLHNGHVHHLKETRRITGADVVIAVMSGNFLQRGEPAFIDKWSRAELALRSGADIVFELPYRFAVAQASEFAQGAIGILAAARCNMICFGSEDGRIEPFRNTLRLLEDEETGYEAEVHRLVKTGISYPSALSQAYRSIADTAAVAEPLADLTKPNNILGFHYMKAARSIEPAITAFTIGRTGTGYHDLGADPDSGIMSATAIREAVRTAGITNEVLRAVPDHTANAMEQFREAHGGFGGWDRFWPILRPLIIRDGAVRLRDVAEMTEGLEHRIARAALDAPSFMEFMETVKTKRYTWTRIQRILTHVLCGVDRDEFNRLRHPRYLRLLGMTAAGRRYLNQYKDGLGLPLVSRVGSSDDPMLKSDIRASDLYAVGIGDRPGKDFRTPPVMAD